MNFQIAPYVLQFRLYQGAKKGKQVTSSTKLGLGENVALRLLEYCKKQRTSSAKAV